MSYRRGLLAGMLAALGGAGVWWNRGALRSGALRLLLPFLQPNPGRQRGLLARFGLNPPPWLWITLEADLGPTLSGVIGQPVEAVAYSRFGGFPLGRGYSEFHNPDSPYYQVWLGAYAVFDGPGMRHFGFDEEGQVLQQGALDVLEADQRLVYRGAGCPRRFDDGRRVHLRADLQVEAVEERGVAWWRLSGEAGTWSSYHRGVHPEGRWHHPWIYGEVPLQANHPVEDWHPLVYRGEFWVRYEPRWSLTCAKFFIYPEYTNVYGNRIARSAELVPELRRLLGAMDFAHA
ncbi:MAG: hypothetical protein GX605_06855 [Chloroflexi bacterium]|nr:hypothetical protein [Chloroflexota bacterium]